MWNTFGYRPVLNGLWLLSKEYIPSYHRCVTAACEETLIRLYVVTENGAMDPFCFLVGLRAKPCSLLYLYILFSIQLMLFLETLHIFLAKVSTEAIFMSPSEVFSLVWTIFRILVFNSEFLIPKPKWHLESFLWRVTQPTGNGKAFRLARNSEIFSPSIWFLRWETYIFSARNLRLVLNGFKAPLLILYIPSHLVPVENISL